MSYFFFLTVLTHGKLNFYTSHIFDSYESVFFQLQWLFVVSEEYPESEVQTALVFLLSAKSDKVNVWEIKNYLGEGKDVCVLENDTEMMYRFKYQHSFNAFIVIMVSMIKIAFVDYENY